MEEDFEAGWRRERGPLFLSAIGEFVFVIFSSEEAGKLLANLKATLAARRMRAFELAGELRISPSVLSEVVTGRREASAELRARIAALLDAEESWLFLRVRPRPVRGRQDAGDTAGPTPAAGR